MKKYIITGTPGSGKTTLIRLLEQQGHAVVEEAATDIIALEQALGNPEPWKEIAFIDKIVKLQEQRQLNLSARPQSLQFFDRSPICTYALCQFLAYAPTENLLKEIDHITNNNIYEKNVFFIDNLGFITPTDARKINYEEALRFEQLHLEAYDQFGYECIRIKPNSIPKRLQQILDQI